MVMNILNERKKALLREGTVIPASPLALNSDRTLSEEHQAAVYRYYIDAGAGGIAVGVHTTQFEIRNPEFGLFEPLLSFASEVIDKASAEAGRQVIKISGVCGQLSQALKEAEYSREKGYDAVLLSLAALKEHNIEQLLTHCREVAKIMPVIGFYLQPAVGGKILPFSFWRRFVEIENVVAVKIAPFNRYQTIDVVRALAYSGREKDITLYTGNDDNIIADLITPYTFNVDGTIKELRIKGGLLGQWSVWTKTFVDLLQRIHQVLDNSEVLPGDLLEKNIQLTDANAAIFDAAHNFAGCIPGINEILRRQGLLPTHYCLDTSLELSPGQLEEIDRVCHDYFWLPDDGFVKNNLHKWLSKN